MMKLLRGLMCFALIVHCSYAPPVTPDKSTEHDSEIKDMDELMEYHRYLKEVVQALESDPEFRERLEKANDEDVRSGKIAEHLDFVNHNVRTRLDEIKRREMERLRHLATRQFELTNDIDTKDTHKVPSNEHLDHVNPHTFEIEDLKKLIKKTTADLEEADKKRKQEFKEYEMEKEFEKHQQLENLEEEKKKEYEKKMKEEEEAKKHHKPLHHPGSKQQLEEVWEKQDHMDQQFDPKVFFMMHDVDGNGVWDADEVKALFIKELDKLYAPNGPNKDLHERAEEMERMREHVFSEADKNRDGLIDFHEFLMETQKSDFNQDQGWQSLDENQIYTQSEYQAFEKRRMEEMKYLQQRGLLDAHFRPIPGAEHQLHQAYQQLHQMAGQYPPGQAPPGYPQVPHGQQAYPQGQAHPNQVPQYGQGQPPQGQPQYIQGQAPPQGQAQYVQGQAPPQGQAQYVQGQAPPQGQAQYVQGQAPPQGQPQYVQGQAPPQGQPQYVQGQAPPQGQAQYAQGQAPPQGQGQVPPQAQGQYAQGQTVPQGQYIQGQVPQQGQPKLAQNQAAPSPVAQQQVPPQGQVQSQGQAPPQGAAVQNQVPPSNH